MKKLLMLLAVVSTATAYAQTISNKLTFQKGQKFEVYTQLNRTSEQEMMGRSMESSVTSATTALFDISDVANDAAVINSSMKRMKFDMSFFGREENFDSDNRDDMNSDIGKMMSRSLNTKYVMTVDPAGVITAVKVEEPEGKKSRGADQGAGMMAMFMGGMSNANTPKAGDPSIFKILPEKLVAKGDTWTDESKDANGTRKTVYTVSAITEKDVLIDFQEESKMDIKQEMMGQSAAVTIKAKSNGKIVLDKNTGVLRQKTFVTTSEEDINAGGMSIPSKSKMTTTITVKPV